MEKLGLTRELRTAKRRKDLPLVRTLNKQIVGVTVQLEETQDAYRLHRAEHRAPRP